jgi:tetratricopeptide (TPR) repeat protein
MRLWIAASLACTTLLVTAHTAAAIAAAKTASDPCYAPSSRYSPDDFIANCTTSIQSGQLSTADLATAYYNRGNAYDDKGDHDRAIADYDQSIRLNPQDAKPYYNRAIAYEAKGDHDRAIADYAQAIGLNPQSADAYYNRGVAYFKKGDYDRAISDLDQYIRLAPSAPDGPALRAKIIAARNGHPG